MDTSKNTRGTDAKGTSQQICQSCKDLDQNVSNHYYVTIEYNSEKKCTAVMFTIKEVINLINCIHDDCIISVKMNNSLPF